MDTLFLVLRVVVALAAVLGLIWFVQRKMTRGGGKKGSLGSRLAPKRSIQVLGTHRLSPKASIAVVDIDGVKLVLGVTEHGISVLEPTPAASPAAAPIAVPEAISSEGDPTQVAASAVEPLATADVRSPEPVDFAAVFREALDEAAEAPARSTVVEEGVRESEHVASRRRRRRVSIPALAEQLLPHMTRTLAGAIGVRVDPATPAPGTADARSMPVPASPAGRPIPQPEYVSQGGAGALAAFVRNSSPEITRTTPLTRDYSHAQPLFERLPVLQRVS